ncbi:MAG TPA: DUF4382 domain-containing protein [Candidatus Acidoferrum sp.]|nr:DUF4382 domain-containing protein [Candidatus Acidoferrum sp.]
MNPKKWSPKWSASLLAFILLAFLEGCGGGMNHPAPQPQSGTVFVSGTDAPLESVVSFQVDVTGLSVTDANNNSQSVLSGTQTVDFARLNGLHALLDINTIPAGTYNSVTVTLANPQISYLNVASPQTTPPTRPTVTTLNGTTSRAVTLTTSSITLNLATPLVVSTGNITGLSFEFNLRKSIVVDAMGQIAGAVTPVLHLKAITPSDSDAFIDDFVAGVVSVNAGGNSFLIQGPHGHQFTVNVNGQTEWENNESINDLTTNSIIELSGSLDRLTATFLADSVGILSQDHFFAGGLVSFEEPQTGAATDFDLYVRSVLPSGTGFNSGQISTIDLTGNEIFYIYWMHTSFTNMFFNSSLLTPGQHVNIGGPFANGAVTVKRVVLQHEGHTGTLVANSTDVGAHTFQFNSNGLSGILFNGPITVFVTPFTRFGGGLTQLSDLTINPTNPLRVVGLVLRDPVSGQPVFVARSVEQLTN